MLDIVSEASQRSTNRPYVTVREVREFFGCTDQTVWRMIKDGRLKATKLGGSSYKINRESFEQLKAQL